ncbi:MAG: hypothetical protein OEZ55_11080 [Nitrospinota bacterium]|nr:hypothetical protein [Nitrospinota bacterium]
MRVYLSAMIGFLVGFSFVAHAGQEGIEKNISNLIYKGAYQINKDKLDDNFLYHVRYKVDVPYKAVEAIRFYENEMAKYEYEYFDDGCGIFNMNKEEWFHYVDSERGMVEWRSMLAWSDRKNYIFTLILHYFSKVEDHINNDILGKPSNSVLFVEFSLVDYRLANKELAACQKIEKS